MVAATFALPLLWVILSSLDPHADLKVKAPDGLTLDNFHAILKPDITFTPLLNSLILCGSGTLLTVVCSALAAYPLSRFQSRLNRPFLLTILFATSLPITAIMVPVYALFVQVNLIDTMQGTIFFFAASQLPFGIWLMKNFMDGVPKELEEAAWTDGASSLQSLVRIVLPLMGPGVAVVTVFSFVMMWGNFFVPFMLLLTPDQILGEREHQRVLREPGDGGLWAVGGVLGCLFDAGDFVVCAGGAAVGRGVCFGWGC